MWGRGAIRATRVFVCGIVMEINRAENEFQSLENNLSDLLVVALKGENERRVQLVLSTSRTGSCCLLPPGRAAAEVMRPPINVSLPAFASPLFPNLESSQVCSNTVPRSSVHSSWRK